MNCKKILFASGIAVFTLLFLNSCSVDVYGNDLEGGQVVFTPIVWLANWFWLSYTPNFWAWIVSAFNVPTIGWLLGTLACVLGGAEYVLNVALWLIAVVAATALCAIGWLLVGVWIGRIG